VCEESQRDLRGGPEEKLALQLESDQRGANLPQNNFIRFLSKLEAEAESGSASSLTESISFFKMKPRAKESVFRPYYWVIHREEKTR
jgi:hypothetical protein